MGLSRLGRVHPYVDAKAEKSELWVSTFCEARTNSNCIDRAMPWFQDPMPAQFRAW